MSYDMFALHNFITNYRPIQTRRLSDFLRLIFILVRIDEKQLWNYVILTVSISGVWMQIYCDYENMNSIHIRNEPTQF